MHLGILHKNVIDSVCYNMHITDMTAFKTSFDHKPGPDHVYS